MNTKLNITSLIPYNLHYIYCMKKKQAQQYFQQLKKIDKSKNMTFAELINILTGGDISLKQVKAFASFIQDNEFGQYSHIEHNIETQDWRQMQFSKVYEVLKAVKDYITKHAPAQLNRQSSRISNKQVSQLGSSRQNNTVIQILNDLKIMQDTESKKRREEQQLQQKWKKYKMKVIKKLLIIFDCYRKTMFVKNESFDKKKDLAEHLNINVFMKYFKQFQLGVAFTQEKVIKCFKNNALNTLWIDFDRFVNTNLQLINFKEDMTNQEKYLKLRGLNELLSVEKVKKMLNINGKTVVTNLVQGHTGAYRQDIITHLEEKYKERQLKLDIKWNMRRVQTEPKQNQKLKSKQELTDSNRRLKSSSAKNIIQRSNTERSHQVYQQLRLPKLRLKEYREQSIYKSLNTLRLGDEHQRLRQLIDIEQNEQFLNQYLKEESRLKERAKSKIKIIKELPPMRFS